jgi:tRNA pseudouridine55 synthase
MFFRVHDYDRIGPLKAERILLSAALVSDKLMGLLMNAILLVDKPAGISSAEVVRRVKSRVKPARVGHLGTLDPFATGLLPIMIGEATKLAPFIDGGDKEYAGLIRLGVETDTLDRDGAEVRRAEVPDISAEKLAQITAQFTGVLDQIPPVYSAIKRAGVPLYRLARRGDDVAPPEKRSVEIKRLDLACEAPDAIRFVATCSPGTYARSLARDIGVALGTVAHLDELRRTRNGTFSITDAMPLADVLAGFDSDLPLARKINLRDALVGLPELVVDTSAEKRLRNGDSRALDSQVPEGGPLFKVISQSGELIAVARATSRVTAIVERIFNPEADARNAT